MRHLIYDNNKNWLLILNLIYKTPWTEAGSGLLILILEKLSLLSLTGLITLVLLMWKWMALLSSKNYFLRCWGCVLLLNWIGVLLLSLLLKLPPRKLEPWFILWSFFIMRSLCIPINLQFNLAFEYCCYVWAGTPSSYFRILDKLQKWICRVV